MQVFKATCVHADQKLIIVPHKISLKEPFSGHQSQLFKENGEKAGGFWKVGY